MVRHADSLIALCSTVRPWFSRVYLWMARGAHSVCRVARISCRRFFLSPLLRPPRSGPHIRTMGGVSNDVASRPILKLGVAAPQTPGIYRIPARITERGGRSLDPRSFRPLSRRCGLHPRSALSSAQVFPEWTTATSPCNDLSANGDYPLNFVSHSRGLVQVSPSCFRTNPRSPDEHPSSDG